MQKIEKITKRTRFIRNKVIVPCSHVEIYLTDYGRKVLESLTGEEKMFLATKLTMYGGYDEDRGVIYIPYSENRQWKRQWQKILKMLRRAEKHFITQ